MAKDRLDAALIRRFKTYGTKKVDYSLTLFQLYITHKGVCQNCKCKTTFGQHPTIDNSATIEHIKPLSHGGDHVKSNVTLLCQKCNYAKNQMIQRQPLCAPETDYKKLFSLFGYEIYFKRSL